MTGTYKVRTEVFARIAALFAIAVAIHSASLARAQFGPIDPRWHDPRWHDPRWAGPTWWNPHVPLDPWSAPIARPLPVPVPVPVPVPIPGPLPRSIRIASEVIADPPLAPARVALVNSTRDPLRVEIIDLKRRQVIGQQDLQPAASVVTTLPRHSGGQAIETYRTYGPLGDVSEREVTRRIAAEVRYEVAVHRWKMQSVAIDRTGKSPSAIEDIQFAGEPVGRFRLPAGEQLVDGQVDVYQAAQGAANAWSVGPIFPGDERGDRSDPLHEALQSTRR